MAKMPEEYDPNDHEPQSDPYEPAPPGVYVVEVTDSELNESRAGDPMPEYTLTILRKKGTDSQFAGKKVWQSFNLYQSTSEQAREIAEGQHSAMCRALGWNQPVTDTEQLHGMTGEVRLGIDLYERDDGEVRRKNIVKAWRYDTDGDDSGGDPWKSSDSTESTESSSSEDPPQPPGDSGGTPDDSNQQSGGGDSKAPTWLK